MSFNANDVEFTQASRHLLLRLHKAASHEYGMRLTKSDVDLLAWGLSNEIAEALAEKEQDS